MKEDATQIRMFEETDIFPPFTSGIWPRAVTWVYIPDDTNIVDLHVNVAFGSEDLPPIDKIKLLHLFFQSLKYILPLSMALMLWNDATPQQWAWLTKIQPNWLKPILYISYLLLTVASPIKESIKRLFPQDDPDT